MSGSYARALVWLLLCSAPVYAHDVITTKITWNREIIRILNGRCLSCHHSGGKAFSLTTYNDGRPWAKAIQEEVLERRMPPWGAVKGFGDFRNDRALTPEQLEVIAEWVDGGAPEGEDKDLPPDLKIPESPESPAPTADGAIRVSGDFQLLSDFMLDSIHVETVPEKTSFQLIAILPNGTMHPLLWMLPYKSIYSRQFELRMPLVLPKATLIQGIPAGVTLIFSPPASAAGGSVP
ncbi:MAG: cytochrome c [Bryobacteraceae bacterium]